MASCVAERNAESTSSTGTIGTLEVPAEPPRRFTASTGDRCRAAHSQRGSLQLATEGRESGRPCEVLTFAVVPGFRVRLQKSIGDAWSEKRLPVAAGNRGQDLASGGVETTAGETAIVIRCPVESANGDRGRARGGFLYRSKVSRAVKAEAHHVGRRRQRSRPNDSNELKPRENRAATEASLDPCFAACSSEKTTLGGAAECRPKRAVAACRHRPPVRSGAPSTTKPETARFNGCSSLTCGLQTSARRISGS